MVHYQHLSYYTLDSFHDKSYNKTYATSEDSDHPTQTLQSSLIACIFYKLRAIQRVMIENPFRTGSPVDVQADVQVLL